MLDGSVAHASFIAAPIGHLEFIDLLNHAGPPNIVCFTGRDKIYCFL